MTQSARVGLLDRICTIAREAGDVIMPYFESDDLVTHRKRDRSQVTGADRAAEALIIAALRKLTPDLPIVAEEAVEAGHVPDVKGRSFWLVDPLDGTKEFIQRIPEFTVNIALIEEGRPVLGVVYAPAGDLLYAGSEAEGAFIEEHGERRSIAARRVDPDGITVALSRTYGAGVELDRFLQHYRVTKQVLAGSSIKFCLVARGEADVYPRYGGSMEWDTAAGHAVVSAAGGSVREIDDGPPLVYGKPGFRNPNFIVWGRTH